MFRKVVMLAFALFIFVIAGPDAAEAQSGNLLPNPSFEGSYSAYHPQTPEEWRDCPAGVCNTVQIPSDWRPWWRKEVESDANPEYKEATAPFMNRVHEGAKAGQYFTFYRTHKAGYYQRVNVPANANLQFSIWGQAWVSSNDDLTSDPGAVINMRIGIDPTGGTDAYSSNVVWSGFQNPMDAYQLFTVQAQAQGTVVSVFTYSAPPYPLKHNDVYWDDAALTVGGNVVPPPPPPAPPPTGGGSSTYIVQPGDTLSAIAARFGVTLTDLLNANDIPNPNLIRVGQSIVIPGGGSTPPPAPPPSPTGVSATTIPNLRLRSGPGTEYVIQTVIPSGTTLPVLARNAASSWLKVSYNGATGWVAAWHTLISGSVATVPIE